MCKVMHEPSKYTILAHGPRHYANEPVSLACTNGGTMMTSQECISQTSWRGEKMVKSLILLAGITA